MFFLVMLITFLPRCLTFRQLENILILLENLQRLLLVGLRVLGLRAWSLCPLERRAVCRDKVFPQIPFVLHHLQVKGQGDSRRMEKFTFSHMVQATPWDWMWTLTMCCFKLKLFEKVFQQYSQTLGCIHRHLFLGWVAWEPKLLGPPPPSPGFPPSPSWFGYEPWIFSSCWAGMGSRIRTRDWIAIIWVFYLSDLDPFAPYRASSVLLKCHRC